MFSLQGHLEKLIRAFVFACVNHKSRHSVYVHGHRTSELYYENTFHKIEDDLNDFVKKKMDYWKEQLKNDRISKASMHSSVWFAAENFRKIANDKKLLIIVTGGEQLSEGGTLARKLKEEEGVRVEVFGIFSGENDPVYRRYGDDTPFLIRNLEHENPADLYTTAVGNGDDDDGYVKTSPDLSIQFGGTTGFYRVTG
ncbi:hypothetical protein Y032_0714g1758 [Ancylostoma ceylanicum]|nr:hypothetical protein Y032_0714g1758 [Ancylostoma ceylanicum]